MENTKQNEKWKKTEEAKWYNRPNMDMRKPEQHYCSYIKNTATITRNLKLFQFFQFFSSFFLVFCLLVFLFQTELSIYGLNGHLNNLWNKEWIKWAPANGMHFFSSVSHSFSFLILFLNGIFIFFKFLHSFASFRFYFFLSDVTINRMSPAQTLLKHII